MSAIRPKWYSGWEAARGTLAAMLAPLLAAHLLLAADPASAPPPPPSIVLSPEEAEAAAEAARTDDLRHWYGWETLFTDGLSVACLAGSAASGGGSAGPALLLCGVGLYSFGGPLMHMRREHWSAGLVDVGLRVVLPVGTFGLALVSGLLGTGWTQLSTAPVAMAVGGAIAMGVDAFGLAWEPGPKIGAARASIQWSPFAGAVRGAPTAGLAGTF